MATNAKLKMLKIAWGMFHRRAFLWSAMIAGPAPMGFEWTTPGHSAWEKIKKRFDYIGTREFGKKLMEEYSYEIFAVTNYGGTTFRRQDIGVENLNYKTTADKWLALQPNNAMTGAMKETLNRLGWWTQHLQNEMFGIFGGSLKTATVVNETRRLIAKNSDKIAAEKDASEKIGKTAEHYDNYIKTFPENAATMPVGWHSETEAKIYRTVAGMGNADFGGLHTRRMGISEGTFDTARLLFLGPDWCVPVNTRAMTKTGWKYHHELSVGDEIMVFDPETKLMRWSPLQDKYHNPTYKGPMVQIKNWNRSIMMTPEHTCYVNNFTTGKTEVVKASDLQTNHTIPRIGNYSAPKKEIYSDFLIKMVGWLVTDGHVDTSSHLRKDGTRNTRGRIKQAKPHTVQMLKNLGLTYSVAKILTSHGKYKDNYFPHQFTIPTDTFREIEAIGLSKGLTADFIEDLSMRQRELLYETMLLGDGTGQRRFCGKEKEVFNMVMLQTMMGSASTFWQQEENCWLTRRLADRKQVVSCWGHNDNRRNIDWSGEIWCPSTKTGFWLAEREGLIFITGNTLSNFQTVSKLWLNKSGVTGGAGTWTSGSDLERQVYMHFWGRIIARVAVIVAAINLLMAGADDESLLERTAKAKKARKLKILQADISPVMHFFGGDKSTDHYFNVAGQFLDPVKWAFDPVRSAVNKGSSVSKPVIGLIGGTNYRHQRPSSIGNIASDGLYSYKSFRRGPPSPSEMPAVLAQEAINTWPVQFQKVMSVFQGEENVISAILEGTAGLEINQTYPRK